MSPIKWNSKFIDILKNRIDSNLLQKGSNFVTLPQPRIQSAALRGIFHFGEMPNCKFEHFAEMKNG
jgi:hypothetical protein